MATVGRSKAVCDFGRVRFSGFVAWLTWLFVHIMYLVGFENRLLVLTQWTWNYLTRNRGARLITGPNPLPLPLGEGASASTKAGAVLRSFMNPLPLPLGEGASASKEEV